MRELDPPRVGGLADRTCRSCGRQAAVHGRVRRAIYDWEVTFVECLRLRCCGRTFTTAPEGLSPGSRYSDRVVGLARALVAAGESTRRCSRLLEAVGVPVSHQSVRAWCRRTRREAEARARVTTGPCGQVGLDLRSGLWLVFDGPSPDAVEELLARKWRASHEE